MCDGKKSFICVLGLVPNDALRFSVFLYVLAQNVEVLCWDVPAPDMELHSALLYLNQPHACGKQELCLHILRLVATCLTRKREQPFCSMNLQLHLFLVLSDSFVSTRAILVIQAFLVDCTFCCSRCDVANLPNLHRGVR